MLAGLPCGPIRWEDKGWPPMSCDSGIDSKWLKAIYLPSFDGAGNKRRPNHIPPNIVDAAPAPELAFLRVVKVGLEGDARIGFKRRGSHSANLHAVVLCTGL